MTLTPSSRFRKQFDDRYLLWRESQILGVLNQRNLPVPALIMTHGEQRYIEMAHAGQDLRAWLKQRTPSPAAVCNVVEQSVRALTQAAEIGVWHLDVAARNFMVAQHNGAPQVLLIDFANALSADFPLRKPLYISPSPVLHPGLCAALVEDWCAFFMRRGLTPPSSWEQDFEVPSSHYAEDWTVVLAVERQPERWPWLAHGVGHLLMEVAQLSPAAAQQGLPAGLPLQRLEGNERARRAIGQVLQQLLQATNPARTTSAWGDATPRPRLVDLPPIRMAASPVPEMPAASSSLQEAPQPTQPNALAPRSAPSLRRPRELKKRWPIVIGILASTSGWLVLDTIYAVLRLPATVLLLVAVAAVVVLSLMISISLLKNAALAATWRFLLLTQALGHAALLTDLWLLRVASANLVAAVGCMIITLGCAIALKWPQRSMRPQELSRERAS